MAQNVSDIPHAWLMTEVDVSNLVALRHRVKDAFLLAEGVPLALSSFVLKGIVNALKEFPLLNASWTPAGIAVHKHMHISIATGSGDSVNAPVIRHVDRKSIAGLAIELYELSVRVRNGEIQLPETQGGHFTFKNTGAFGSMLSYPLIQPPQAAVLTFEKIVKKPVVVQEMIAIRSMANVCLSFDHRILDGRICGRFLQRVKQNLEKYNQDSSIY